MSEPSFVTNLMVDSPRFVICSVFTVLIFCTVLTYAFDWLLPMKLSARDYLVWGSSPVNDFDKTLLIKSEIAKQGEVVADLQSTINLEWSTIIMYNTPKETLEEVEDVSTTEKSSSGVQKKKKSK